VQIYFEFGYSDSVTDADGEVVLALHRATHATLAALTARLSALGVGAAELNALATLAHRPPMSASALAVATATRPTTLTGVLDRLAGRGFLTREPDPADRRSFLITLTPAGTGAAGQAAAAVRELAEQALAGVTSAQRDGFFAVVRALSEGPHDRRR